MNLTDQHSSALALRLFIARRYQFARLLESSQSAISTSRFIRLIALAALQIAYTVPIALCLRIIQFVTIPLNHYDSWENVHFGFNYVGIITLHQFELGPKAYARLQELNYWSYAMSCAIFFMFFGLGEESIASYRRWLSKIMPCLGRYSISDEACGYVLARFLSDGLSLWLGAALVSQRRSRFHLIPTSNILSTRATKKAARPQTGSMSLCRRRTLRACSQALVSTRIVHVSLLLDLLPTDLFVADKDALALCEGTRVRRAGQRGVDESSRERRGQRGTVAGAAHVVRLWDAPPANAGCDLADALLVDARKEDRVGRGGGGAHVAREVDEDGVGEPELEVEPLCGW